MDMMKTETELVYIPSQWSQAYPSTHRKVTPDPYLGSPTTSVQNNNIHPIISGKKMHTNPSIDTT